MVCVWHFLREKDTAGALLQMWIFRGRPGFLERIFQDGGKEYHKNRQKRENLRRLQMDRNLCQKRKRKAVKKNSAMEYQFLGISS